jgi:tetratricopeptide (TPR) repeat protein
MSDQLLLQAISASARGDFPAVVELLEPLLASPSVQGGVLGCLGYAYSRLGRFAESASCWHSLLSLDVPPRVRGKVQANLGRASYYAAAAEVRAGRYAAAERYLAAYSKYYPGDAESKGLSELLSRILKLQEAASALEAARDSIAGERWSEAADLLISAGSKIDRMDIAN